MMDVVVRVKEEFWEELSFFTQFSLRKWRNNRKMSQCDVGKPQMGVRDGTVTIFEFPPPRVIFLLILTDPRMPA